MTRVVQVLGAAGPYWRLAAALCLSAALHGLFLLGTRLGQVERPGEVTHLLQVRLAEAQTSSVSREPKQAPAPSEVAPLPKQEPEPAPPSRTEPSPQDSPQVAEAKPGMPEKAAGATTLDVPLPADPNYYPAREVDEHPALVAGGRPVYPEKAARESIKGEVTVLIMLNEHGSADEVSVVEVKPEGHAFEDAVTAWLRDARFKPAIRKGRAVKARVVFRVTFDPADTAGERMRGSKTR